MLFVQFGGERFHPGHVNLLEPISLLGVVCVFGVIGLPLVGMLAEYSRNRVRSRRARRRQARATATAEQRARALMGELCPHGWQAQITLLGADDGHLLDGLGRVRSRVALDWVALEADSGRTAVVRRVWAPTIGEALDAMVTDRRTDETLEQIEQRAFADGAPWPDS